MKKILSFVLALVVLCSCLPGAAATETAGLQAQVDAAKAGATITLQADETEAISISKNLTLNLNGFSVLGQITVAEGCTLTVKDSATDDYTVEDAKGYGKLATVSGTVVAARNYIQLKEAEGISFHKVSMTVTKATLRPAEVGIYYTGEFYGDEVVADQVEVFGIVLRLKVAPDAAYMRTSSACSRYYNFKAGSAGNTATGTLLKNVMRKGRPTAENNTNSQLRIYGMPYLRTQDGQYYFGSGVNCSFMKVVQEADAQWKSLDQTQRNALQKLHDNFKSIMSEWLLPNLHPGDIDIPI